MKMHVFFGIMHLKKVHLLSRLQSSERTSVMYIIINIIMMKLEFMLVGQGWGIAEFELARVMDGAWGFAFYVLSFMFIHVSIIVCNLANHDLFFFDLAKIIHVTYEHNICNICS
ncbi:hypothetical protein R6Q59_017763 [Mikania micrantha]